MGPFNDEQGLQLTPAHRTKDMLILAWGSSGGGSWGDVMHQHEKKKENRQTCGTIWLP